MHTRNTLTHSALLDKQQQPLGLQSAQAHSPLTSQCSCPQTFLSSISDHTLNTCFLNQHLLSTTEGCLCTKLFQMLCLDQLGALMLGGLVWLELDLHLPALSALEAQIAAAVLPVLPRQFGWQHYPLYTNAYQVLINSSSQIINSEPQTPTYTVAVAKSSTQCRQAGRHQVNLKVKGVSAQHRQLCFRCALILHGEALIAASFEQLLATGLLQLVQLV